MHPAFVSSFIPFPSKTTWLPSSSPSNFSHSACFSASTFQSSQPFCASPFSTSQFSSPVCSSNFWPRLPKGRYSRANDWRIPDSQRQKLDKNNADDTKDAIGDQEASGAEAQAHDQAHDQARMRNIVYNAESEFLRNRDRLVESFRLMKTAQPVKLENWVYIVNMTDGLIADQIAEEGFPLPPGLLTLNLNRTNLEAFATHKVDDVLLLLERSYPDLQQDLQKPQYHTVDAQGHTCVLCFQEREIATRYLEALKQQGYLKNLYIVSMKADAAEENVADTKSNIPKFLGYIPRGIFVSPEKFSLVGFA